MALHNVGARSQTKGFLHYVRGRFLTHEDYFRFWGEFANLSSGLDTVQCVESDVEENQIRFKLYRLLNRFLAVAHLADDLQVGPLAQCRTDKMPKWEKILRKEDADQ